MEAEIIAVGSELLSGTKSDTNGPWLTARLAAGGISTRYHTIIGDLREDNLEALTLATRRASLVLVSGGLGPTQDDLTREIVAEVAGRPLVEDPECLVQLRQFFESRQREMPERNRVQALIPDGAEPILNRIGTAPGLWMPIGESLVVCLPGVPRELKIMFLEQVEPRLAARSGQGRRFLLQEKINLFGRGESEIEAEALDLTARGRHPEVGITAHDGTISFRIISEAANFEEAQAALENTRGIIEGRFDELIVGRGDDDIEHDLARMLLARHVTLAVAESCTGGRIASDLTSVPGISDVFLGGVVCYSNASKVDVVGVDPGLIAGPGAVSAEVAAELARNIRERFHSDLGLAVTGIAGPGGGSPEKPVGLVFLGLSTEGGTATRRLLLGAEQPRDVIQSRSAKHALNWARLHLRRNPDVGEAPSW